MTNEKDAPERIYMHPTSAEANVNPWPLEPGEYVEYVRADLLASKTKEVIAKVKVENPPHNAGNEFARGFARAKKTILGQLEAALTEK